jgi:uncharacterized protein YndB with AHSA1/START domain
MAYMLTVERMMDAPPEVVFDALLDRDSQEEIFAGPPDSEARLIASELDLRVGGTWTMLFRQPDGSEFRLTYVFTEIDRPRRLSALFSMEYAAGVEDSAVTLTFEPEGDKTLLMIVQDGFETESLRDAYRGGAPYFFNRLQEVVARRMASETKERRGQ